MSILKLSTLDRDVKQVFGGCLSALRAPDIALHNEFSDGVGPHDCCHVSAGKWTACPVEVHERHAESRRRSVNGRQDGEPDLPLMWFHDEHKYVDRQVSDQIYTQTCGTPEFLQLALKWGTMMRNMNHRRMDENQTGPFELASSGRS